MLNVMQAAAVVVEVVQPTVVAVAVAVHPELLELFI
jgi:hypothetical protein